MLAAVLGAPLAAEGTRPPLVAVAADGVGGALAVVAHETRHARALGHWPECRDSLGLWPGSGRCLCGGRCGVTGREGHCIRLVR